MTKADEKWDTIGDNPLVIISELFRVMTEHEWIDELDHFIEDEDFVRILNITARMIGGEVPEPSQVAMVCVKLEAAAIKFRMQYVAYMGFKKGTTDANMRKNHYKELYTGIDRLVDSLKYLVK